MRCAAARPQVYVGTSVIFFAITNAVKLVPYFALGQFDATNLTASAVLMPIAPAGDARRRLAGPAHEAGDLLSLHLRHGRRSSRVKLIYDGVLDLLG